MIATNHFCRLMLILALALSLKLGAVHESAVPAQDILAQNILTQDSSASSPIGESATSPTRDAMRDTAWYDADEGSLIPVAVEDETDDSVNRYSRWLPQAKKVRKPKTTTTTAGGTTGTGGGNIDWSFGNLFGWFLLTLCVVTGVGLLVYALSKAEIELGTNEDVVNRNRNGKAPDAQTVERMQHLPAELRRTDVNMRTEAKRLMGEGKYDQAIILLFGHQLLMLDRHGTLRLTRGKTNGRYVRETRRADRELGDRLRLTATAFERSYFGRHEITASEFERLWKNNESLEDRVQSRQEVAA